MSKILIIEDDESVTGFLEAYLTSEGYDIEIATDGLAGLLKLQRPTPADLAIVDIMMPDVDGIRVLRQLLEEGDGRLGVPVVVITGSPEAAARCRQLLDPIDVIEKPFDPDRLLARVRAHLGQEPS